MTLVQQSLNLEALEAVIERGMQTFVEVGAALLTIREQRLYRAQYGTFEEYCQERWGWARHRANRLIQAVEVVHDLVPTGTADEAPALPVTERVARELAPLPNPEQRREAWQRTTYARA